MIDAVSRFRPRGGSPAALSLSLVLASVFLASLAAVPFAPGLAAQQTFEGAEDVVEIQVPVSVVDRDGNPVRGLTVDDFEILDEGEKRTITGFDVIDLERLVAERGRGTQLAQELPAVARRHFLLLFDLSFADPVSILRARDAARQFVLEELHPTDLAAVAILSVEQGPRLLVTFTPDRAQLARAIDTLGARGLLERDVRDPLAFLIDTPSGASDYGGGLGADPLNRTRQGERPVGQTAAITSAVLAHLNVLAKQFDRSQRSFQRAQVTNWARTMSELGRALDSVSGRKQVLLFSEGFNSELLIGRRPDSNDVQAQRDQLSIVTGNAWLVDSDQMYGSTDLQNEVASMLESLRRSDVTIQAIDIGGLRAGADVRDQLGNAGQDGLFYIANETGGALFKDANRLDEQIGEVLDRSSVTYLLSFRPEELAFDGSFHRLRVKVDGHRASRVSHRSGYYEPRPFPALHPLEKNLLASEAIAAAAPRNDLDLDVLAVPFKANEQAAYVPVILEVGGASLLIGHEHDQLPVEVYTYVTNDRGEMRDFFSETVALDISAGRDAFLEGGLKYYGHLDLEPGEYLIRVLVRNAHTGRAGVSTVSLTVPSFQEMPAVLLPPFFLEDSSRWVLVRENAERSGTQSVVYPFIVKGNPFIPAVRPVLDETEPAEVCLVAYNLGAGDIRLAGTVRGADGTEMGGAQLALVERTATGIEGVDKLLAHFRPNGLPAGDYTLEVEVADAAGGTTDTSSISFSVLN